MLCLTAAEPAVEAVLHRIEAHPTQLHEVRLDCLASADPDLTPLLAHADHLLLTLRTSAQGGRFDQGHAAYEQRIGRLLREHPGLVDVEWSDAPHVARLIEQAPHRVVLSWHGRGAAAAQLDQVAADMAVSPVALRKLAVDTSDAADLGHLLDVAARLPRPFVVLGLGVAGRTSRILYRRFGSAWTFASLGTAVPGAPGQLSLVDANLMMPGDDLPTPLGILGGDQVAHSPGVRVYNYVFRDRRLPYSYVAWPTARLTESLATIARLGFRGLSVTMPHKQAALACCAQVDPLAMRVGAVNTLVRDGDQWTGFNTDVGAVRDAVLAAGGAPGQHAAILGAGGAARAAVVALASAGLTIDVFARSPTSAHELRGLGGAVAVRPWTDFRPDRARVVVNATPIGSDGRACPVDTSANLSGIIVMEMIHTPEATPLVQLARASGATVITGKDMWLLQAVEQMRHCLGLTLNKDELGRAWDLSSGKAPSP